MEEIHLSFTVLLNSSNGRLWYPNEKLRLNTFINLTASGYRSESFRCGVDLATPVPALLDALRAAGERVLKEAPAEYGTLLAVNLRDGGDPLKMTVSVAWEYSHSGVDVGRMNRARTRMYTALSQALCSVGARYTWPPTADIMGGGGGGGGGGTAPAAAGIAHEASLEAVVPRLLRK